MKPDTQTPLADITQRQGLRRRKITLYADRIETLDRRPTSGSQRFAMLSNIKSPPDKFRRFPQAVAVIVFPVFMYFVLLLAMLNSEFMSDRELYTILTIGLIIALGIASIGLKALGFMWVFTYKPTISSLPESSVSPDIWLKIKKPSEAAVNQFIEEVERANKEFEEYCKSMNAAFSGVSQADVLDKFAELRDEGILTSDEFALAKSKILGEQRGRMGFR